MLGRIGLPKTIAGNQAKLSQNKNLGWVGKFGRTAADLALRAGLVVGGVTGVHGVAFSQEAPTLPEGLTHGEPPITRVAELSVPTTSSQFIERQEPVAVETSTAVHELESQFASNQTSEIPRVAPQPLSEATSPRTDYVVEEQASVESVLAETSVAKLKSPKTEESPPLASLSQQPETIASGEQVPLVRDLETEIVTSQTAIAQSSQREAAPQNEVANRSTTAATNKFEALQTNLQNRTQTSVGQIPFQPETATLNSRPAQVPLTQSTAYASSQLASSETVASKTQSNAQDNQTVSAPLATQIQAAIPRTTREFAAEQTQVSSSVSALGEIPAVGLPRQETILAFASQTLPQSDATSFIGPDTYLLSQIGPPISQPEENSPINPINPTIEQPGDNAPIEPGAGNGITPPPIQPLPGNPDNISGNPIDPVREQPKSEDPDPNRFNEEQQNPQPVAQPVRLNIVSTVPAIPFPNVFRAGVSGRASLFVDSMNGIVAPNASVSFIAPLNRSGTQAVSVRGMVYPVQLTAVLSNSLTGNSLFASSGNDDDDSKFRVRLDAPMVAFGQTFPEQNFRPAVGAGLTVGIPAISFVAQNLWTLGRDGGGELYLGLQSEIPRSSLFFNIGAVKRYGDNNDSGARLMFGAQF